jgi:hypothetical protein
VSVPTTRAPGQASGRWETIRYALDSNARTARLCAILLVTSLSSAAVTVAVVLVHHVL